MFDPLCTDGTIRIQVEMEFGEEFTLSLWVCGLNCFIALFVLCRSKNGLHIAYIGCTVTAFRDTKQPN